MNTTEGLLQANDIRGLIRLLDHGNRDTQWRAADALGTLGEPACDPLIGVLDYHKVNVRIGAIEALGTIRCNRSLNPLIRKLKSDPDSEVRWVAALALGEIGDSHAIPALKDALTDRDRYVRYGAVTSLKGLNWKPDTDTWDVYALIALQDWKAIRPYGPAAVGPLVRIYHLDTMPSTRLHCVKLLGELCSDEAKKTCESALMDRDPDVRWAAVLACRRCGVDTRLIPLLLVDRAKTTPSPYGAALLNFFFFGLGYNYIGKWWGFLVFMSYMTILVLFQLEYGLLLPYLCVFPFTAVSAVHTYLSVKKMSDM